MDHGCYETMSGMGALSNIPDTADSVSKKQTQEATMKFVTMELIIDTDKSSFSSSG